MKRYWYVLGFIHLTNDGGETRGSAFVGFSEKKITAARISQTKKDVGISSDAMLICCSYLGRMTAEEFNEKEAP